MKIKNKSKKSLTSQKDDLRKELIKIQARILAKTELDLVKLKELQIDLAKIKISDGFFSQIKIRWQLLGIFIKLESLTSDIVSLAKDLQNEEKDLKRLKASLGTKTERIIESNKNFYKMVKKNIIKEIKIKETYLKKHEDK